MNENSGSKSLITGIILGVIVVLLAVLIYLVFTKRVEAPSEGIRIEIPGLTSSPSPSPRSLY